MSYYDPTPDSDYLQDAIKEIEKLEAELIALRSAIIPKYHERIESLEAENIELKKKLEVATEAIKELRNLGFHSGIVKTVCDQVLKSINRGEG